MTDLIDRADSGDIHRAPGEATENLAAYILRQGEVYTASRLAAAPTMIVPTLAAPKDVADAKLRAGEPFLGLPSLQDSYITSGEIPPFLSYALSRGGLQEPPTGNPPPLLPPPPTPAKAEERPDGFRPAHRRRLDRLVKGVLIGAGVVTAALLGVDVAALLVMGVFR